jgi:hypothetical protein
MNIVLDSPEAKIWSDDNAPYAFSIFFSWPVSESEFSKIADKYYALLKKVKSASAEVYSICDISQPSGFPAASIVSLFEACIEKQLKLGIKHKAFVLPENFAGGLFTKEAVVKSEKISFHKSFQQALMEVNKMRINGINSNLAVL